MGPWLVMPYPASYIIVVGFQLLLTEGAKPLLLLPGPSRLPWCKEMHKHLANEGSVCQILH